MAHVPAYSAILNDLNRDVARNQPEDVLQFCANWFNSKLEEQRSVSRQASPRSATFGELSGGPKDTRSQSLPPMPAATGPSSSSGRKKVTVPSLGNSGYTFGSASPTTYTAEDPAPNEPPMSPYSESGPTATNTEQPAGPFAGHQSAMRGSTPPPSSASAPASSLQQPPPQSPRRGSVWNQSFGTKPHHDRRGPHVDSSSDLPPDEPSPRQASGVPAAANAASAPTTPIGIPLNYNLGRRTSVSAESLDPSQATPMAKTVIPKSASQRARIEASIKGNLLFRNLDDEQHADVLNAMKEVRVPENTEVIVQGAVGDFFYVVESGQFEVWVKPPASHRYDPATRRTIADQAPAKMVARIEAGGSFGELALMYNAPRAATVVSTSPSSTLWALDRVTFRSILMEHTSRKRKMYEHFLGEVNILVSLETHERAKIADALEEKVYEEGEAVVIEGEVGKNFYIIESGTAQVLKRSPEGHDEEVSTLGRGDYFGELALMNSRPRAATVRAMPGAGRLRVATLGEKAFTRLLGPVVDILQRRAERTYTDTARSSSAAPADPQRRSSTHSRGSSAGLESSSKSLRSRRSGSSFPNSPGSTSNNPPPPPMQVGA